MKFKGQGKINICGFEYKKNIADSRRGGGGPSTPHKNLYPRQYTIVCSRPEDGLRCRQGVNPPLKLKTHVVG